MKKVLSLSLGLCLAAGAVLTVFAVDEEPFGIRFIKSSAYGWLFSEKERQNAANAADKPDENPPADADYTYKRVVIIGVDGAGAFFKDADMPNVRRIFENGAVTYNCITSTPSISAECWGALMHGVTPEFHKLTNASGIGFPMTSEFPSFFHVTRDAYPDAQMASFVNWNLINVAIIEDKIGVYTDQADTDEQVTEKIEEYLDSNDPMIMFVQFDEVDGAGHYHGFGGEVHMDQLLATDGYIGRIYDKLDEKGLLEDTLFILTADHGGTIYTDENGELTGSHGGDSYEEMNIMVAAVGKTVIPGSTIGEMGIRDIAAIVLHAFGLEQPKSWTARVPSGLFQGVEAGERPEYEYVENVRFENQGGETPAQDSGKYITDFFNADDIASYITMDGKVADDLGKIRTTCKGKSYFVDGYVGQSMKMVDGYVLSQFVPANNSFSISFWLNATASGGNPPIICNKDWYKFESEGFALALEDDHLHFNIGNGTEYAYANFPLPEDYRDGWVHVDLIVDRDSEKVSLCYDFGEILTFELPENMKGVSFNGKMRGINFGSDGSGNYFIKLPADLDDIVIFNRAITAEDIATLASYYGIK